MNGTIAAGPAPASAVGGAFFLGPDTNLRLTAFNSASGVTLTVAGQVLGVDGRVTPFVYTHVPNTDRSVSSQVLVMGTGWILNAEIFSSSASPRRGQTFVRLELVQGREGAVTSLGTILQGYVTDTNALAWPGSELTQSTEGRGNLRVITGTNPGAGVNITEVVPTNARWRLLGITFVLVTDATVANRNAAIVYDDGASVYSISANNVNTPATTTQTYSFSSGLGTFGSGGNAVMGTLPTDLMLAGGHRIRSSTTNFQAADDYGAPVYLVEEWIED